MDSNPYRAVAQSGIPQLPSFSTPGFGKQKPRPPPSSALHAHSSNEALDISSSDPISPSSALSIPHKRLSSELAPPLPTSPKRPRIAPCSDKENTFSAPRKGKEREGRSPPPSQSYTFHVSGPLAEITSTSSALDSPSRRVAIASRSFIYDYKVHSDLQEVISMLLLFVPR